MCICVDTYKPPHRSAQARHKVTGAAAAGAMDICSNPPSAHCSVGTLQRRVKGGGVLGLHVPLRQPLPLLHPPKRGSVGELCSTPQHMSLSGGSGGVQGPGHKAYTPLPGTGTPRREAGQGQSAPSEPTERRVSGPGGVLGHAAPPLRWRWAFGHCSWDTVMSHDRQSSASTPQDRPRPPCVAVRGRPA